MDPAHRIRDCAEARIPAYTTTVPNLWVEHFITVIIQRSLLVRARLRAWQDLSIPKNLLETFHNTTNPSNALRWTPELAAGVDYRTYCCAKAIKDGPEMRQGKTYLA